MSPIGPPPATGVPIAYSALDIITDALIEIGAVPAGEPPAAEEAQWGFRKLNYLVDEWQAQAGKVYSYSFLVFTLQAGLSPHTIGNSGTATFSTAPFPRPVKLESAALLLNTASPTGLSDQPMRVRDRQWWEAQQTKAVQTNVPTDVYYEPTAPDGSLYFWPVPNAANQVRLQIANLLAQYTVITDPLGGYNGPGTLPPAYRAALMYTLAERLIPGSNRPASPELKEAARVARAALFGNNGKSPRVSTQDSGMPRSGSKGRGDFNWATGGAPGGAPE